MTNFKLFNFGVLKLPRAGNRVKGVGCVYRVGGIRDGSQEVMLIARSNAGLHRALTDLCPESEISAKGFFKVEVKL